jgi:dienelactone hydrolase
MWAKSSMGKDNNRLRKCFSAVVGSTLLSLSAGCTTIQWDGNSGFQEDRIIEPILDHDPLVAEVSDIDNPPDTLWQSPTYKLYEVFTAEVTAIEPSPRSIFKNPLTRLLEFFNGKDHYSVKRVKFDGSDGTQSNAYLYTPDSEGPHPGIIIFPVLAETDNTLISELLAKQLVRKNYVVLRMERRSLKFSQTDSLAVPMDSFQHTILDARSLKDWLLKQPKVDPDRIGATGISLGSILSATLMGVDPDIKAGVFILGAGNLHDVLSDSALDSIEEFRDTFIKKLELENPEAFSEILHPHTFPFDPIRYARSLHPCSTMIISARFDNVIRKKHTEELHQELGKPDWIIVPSGHKTTFAPFFFWSVNQADRHFRAVFDGQKCESVQQIVPESYAIPPETTYQHTQPELK